LSATEADASSYVPPDQVLALVGAPLSTARLKTRDFITKAYRPGVSVARIARLHLLRIFLERRAMIRDQYVADNRVSSLSDTTGLRPGSKIAACRTLAMTRTSMGSDAPLAPFRRNTINLICASGRGVSLGVMITAEMATHGSGAPLNHLQLLKLSAAFSTQTGFFRLGIQ